MREYIMNNLKQIEARLETAAPLPASKYTWMIYQSARGKKINHGNPRLKPLMLRKGDKWGYRLGTGGMLRIISEEMGITYVYTVSPALFRKLEAVSDPASSSSGTSKRSGSAVKGVSPKTQKSIAKIAKTYANTRNKEIMRFQKLLTAFFKVYPQVDAAALEAGLLKRAQLLANQEGGTIDLTVDEVLNSDLLYMDGDIKQGRTVLDNPDHFIFVVDQPSSLNLLAEFEEWI